MCFAQSVESDALFGRQLTATTAVSKRQAFINAQRHLRQCEGGRYDKPEYWAAFIMLDAM